MYNGLNGEKIFFNIYVPVRYDVTGTGRLRAVGSIPVPDLKIIWITGTKNTV